MTASCPATAAFTNGGEGLPERRGVATGAQLWALFFPTGNQLTARQELKVVWRMTGSGGFWMAALGPGGARIKPSWGPEEHGGSSWQRPGEEWGTGWVFPTPGCWTITAARTVGTGYLTLRVGD